MKTNLAAFLLTSALFATVPAAANTLVQSQTRQSGEATQSLAERRIADLYERLHITPQQSQQWDHFAQMMRDNAHQLAGMYQQRAEHLSSMSAVDNMQSYAQIEQQRAQDVQNLVPAFQELYVSMSDQQKKVADQVFRTYATRAQAHRQAVR